MSRKIIIGIDPGSRIMGYGVLEYSNRQVNYLDSGCIQSTKGSLAVLFQDLQSIIHTYQPEEAAIEEVFFHRNPKSTLVLGQARGVALLALEIAKLPIKSYAARQVKQVVTGYGGANKVQIQHMVQQLLKLSKIPATDAADALGVALCHIHHSQLL